MSVPKMLLDSMYTWAACVANREAQMGLFKGLGLFDKEFREGTRLEKGNI